MRTAMADAEVGDDWFGDDPTVNRLQDRAAEVTGKEAALYVPTGTMANQIGIRLHVHGSGHLVAATSGAHVASTELMTSAVLSGITFRTGDPGPRAWMTADLARELVEAEDPYDVEVVDLIAVENTVGHAGGTVMPVEELRAIRKVADDNDLPIHLDGARIFNAAVAAGVDVTEYTREVDTMMFCVSKGLGAPIGSLVCGTREDIREARRLKILFGGAWRQAGIMAAAGLIALEEGPKRLHEDHARARRLAEGVAEILPGSVDPAMVETNMVFVDTEAVGLAPLDAIERLRDLGVGATLVSGKVRMVTHVDVDDDGRRPRPGCMANHRRDRCQRPQRRRDGPVHEELPRGDRRPDPAGAAAGEVVAGAALRPDPEVRRDRLGPGGLGSRGAPVHADVRRAAGAAARDGRRRHALRHRVDHARQHLGGRLVQDPPGDGEAHGRGEVGHRALRARLHVGPLPAGDVRRRRAGRMEEPRRGPDARSTAGRCDSWCPSATRGRARSG